MKKEFSTKHQLQKFLFGIAENMDFIYDTTYHMFDVNVDWQSFIKNVAECKKCKCDYYTKLGFREKGVTGEDSIKYWNKDILFCITIGYDFTNNKYYAISEYTNE